MFCLHGNGYNQSTIQGIHCENYVYLEILKRIRDTDSIVGNAPWFAVYKKTGGELDFYVRSLVDYKNYGIEVKAGKNSGITASDLLKDGRLDFLYYLKGDTYGGKAKEDKILTVPIYLTGRIDFNLGCE